MRQMKTVPIDMELMVQLLRSADPMARLVYSVVRLSYMAQSIYTCAIVNGGKSLAGGVGGRGAGAGAGAGAVAMGPAHSTGQATTAGSVPYIVKETDDVMWTLYRACIRSAATLYAFLFVRSERAYKALKTVKGMMRPQAFEAAEFLEWLNACGGLPASSVDCLRIFHGTILDIRSRVIHHLGGDNANADDVLERFVALANLGRKDTFVVDVQVRWLALACAYVPSSCPT
jgi:hypothetical protein